MRLVALALTVLLGVAPSLADAPKPEPLPSEAPVQKFGEAHPACLEWTDGCMVCLRGKACSTPGIACTPRPPVCAAPAEKSPIAPGGQKP